MMCMHLHTRARAIAPQATYFGADAWSIHEGGCNYGYIWQDQGPTGWDVAGEVSVANLKQPQQHVCRSNSVPSTASLLKQL
eukprot:355524-Chlamydomonas_euryale.AAC.21